MMRATCGCKQAARRQHFHGKTINFRIATRGVRYIFLAFGKSRRVKNNHIVTLSAFCLRFKALLKF